MWHLCIDNKWTYTSNININFHLIPNFPKNDIIECFICAYSEFLIFKNNDNIEQSNNDNNNKDCNEDKAISLKALSKFVKKVQKYDAKPKKDEIDFKTTLKVYTSRIDTTDKDRLDITRKSAGRIGLIFAPTWDIINKVKKEEIDFDTYKSLYLEEMKKSYIENNIAWFGFFMKERVVLTCYCTDHEKCHRTILAKEILPKYGAKYCGELDLKNSDSSGSSEIQDLNKSGKSGKSKKSSNNGQGSLF